MDIDPNIPKRAFNESESSYYLSVSVPLMRKLRREGNGPKYLKIGSRVLYDVKDLDKFLDKCKKK